MKNILVTGAAIGLWLAAVIHAGAAGSTAATIKLFQFQPKAIEVKAGTTVTWTNGDDIDHSVTAGVPGKPDGTFDSGFFKKGASYAFTFAKPGTYSYFCKRHQSMTGTVTVTP